MSQSLFTLILAGTVASTMLLAVLGVVVHRLTERARAFDLRLAVPRAQALTAAPRSAERAGSGDPGAAHSLGLGVLKTLSVLAPVSASEREKLAAALRGAGFAHREAIAYFLSAKIGSGAVFGAAAGFFAASSELLGQHGLLVVFAALAGVVVGGVVPEYVVRALGARRVRAMSAALPDAFDLMVMGLESGLTFERSLLAVAEELVAIEPGLAAEFRQIEAELRLGANRRSVLEELFDRTEVEGLKSLAMTLIQSERYGTSLSQSLKNTGADERLQRATRIATQAERLPVLMTLPMLMFVVPGTMLLVAGPAFLTAIKALGSLGGG